MEKSKAMGREKKEREDDQEPIQPDRQQQDDQLHNKYISFLLSSSFAGLLLVN